MTNPSLEPDFRQKLIYRFRKQADFTADYSPLYSCLFSTIADWLEPENENAVASWLIAASNGRNSFDIPLLLAAGLHRDILLKEPAVNELAAYYPNVGGERPFTDSHFPAALKQAILTQHKALADFIQNGTVQTNETGRGFCWLLPLNYTQWQASHLIDLGASAGLNLAADYRAYRFVAETTQQTFFLDIGYASPTQFLTHCRSLPSPLSPLSSLPHLLSRLGCDIQPFLLETAVHENTLAAYIWPDQIQRHQRLREGIAAFHAVNQTDVPIQLYPVTLPDELPSFLANHLPVDAAPVVLYNTYITQYLPQKGERLGQYITDWAVNQSRPILWLQWEPDRSGQDAPEYGWLKWTADFWHNQTYQQFHLAWVHPHGTHLQIEPDFQQWVDYFSSV